MGRCYFFRETYEFEKYLKSVIFFILSHTHLTRAVKKMRLISMFLLYHIACSLTSQSVDIYDTDVS